MLPWNSPSRYHQLVACIFQGKLVYFFSNRSIKHLPHVISLLEQVSVKLIPLHTLLMHLGRALHIFFKKKHLKYFFLKYLFQNDAPLWPQEFAHCTRVRSGNKKGWAPSSLWHCWKSYSRRRRLKGPKWDASSWLHKSEMMPRPLLSPFTIYRSLSRGAWHTRDKCPIDILSRSQNTMASAHLFPLALEGERPIKCGERHLLQLPRRLDQQQTIWEASIFGQEWADGDKTGVTSIIRKQEQILFNDLRQR